MSDEIEKLREELAEANARRDDLRTALEWANEERDRLQRERDEHKAKREEYAAEARSLRERLRDAYGERDQYLRERDQARLAEERARESLDELDEAIYDCLPSDDDGDTPLDCVEHAADQLRALAQERDEARREASDHRLAAMAASSAHDAIEKMVRFELRAQQEEGAQEACRRVARERDEARAEVKRMKARPVEAEYAELDIMWQRLVRERDDAYRAKRDAYRRGAEAMREACAEKVDSYTAWNDPPTLGFLEERILALPIPEDK